MKTTKLTRWIKENSPHAYQRLSKKTGLSASCLWSITRGISKNPRPETIRKIAKALNTTERELTK